MQAQRTRDTEPEIEIRRRLHAMGLRYRVDVAPVPGLRRRADLVFSTARVAVFIDGCFWHGCPDHGTSARANAEFWATKISRNRARDRDTDLRLSEAGWNVIRAWEHEAPDDAAQRVARFVRDRIETAAYVKTGDTHRRIETRTAAS